MFILTAVVLLPISHLVPLPPETWQQLPGRGIVGQIDALAGLREQWRPFSMVPASTWNALYALSVPVAVFALAVQLDAQDHIRLLLVLIGLAIVSGTLGLLQVSGIDIRLYALSSESAGLFANRNHQGVLLAMLFPMLAVAAAVCGTIGVPGRLGVIVAGALAIIAVPLIIVTGSRAGLIASVFAVLLVPVLGLRRSKGRKAKNPWFEVGRLGVAAGVAAALIGVTIFASREMALVRLGSLDDDMRYPVWVSIVHMLPAYLPWGSGIGSYVDVYQILEPDALLRPTFSNHAHNEWLEIALTAGVSGMVLMAWAVALFLYATWRAFRAPGLPGAFSRLGLSIIVLLAFASTVDYPVRTPIMASVLAIAAVWAGSFRKFGNADGRG